MDNHNNLPPGFPNLPVTIPQYSFAPTDPSISINGGPMHANKPNGYNTGGFEDIPDIEAYERSLHIDMTSFSMAGMSNPMSNPMSNQMPNPIPNHMPNQMPNQLPSSHMQPQIPLNVQTQIPPLETQISSQSSLLELQSNQPEFTTLVGKFESKRENKSQSQNSSELSFDTGFKLITPKLEVIDDQTPIMSPASTSNKVMHRNGIKLELPPYLDPDSVDDDPEDGVNYPEPDLFDIKTTVMTEYELDLLKQKQLGVGEPRKKLEVPDASAPPNKIVEFLMYNRTLKENELIQINSYRTKRNRLSLNHVKNNADREFDQKACESLVKKLKDKKHDLQNLLDVVNSKGKKYSGCITIPRTLDGRLQVHGRKGFPHVVYGKLWRFAEMTKNETRHVDHCKHAFEMKSDLVCVNPYHYEIVIGTMIVGQRESHDSRDTPHPNNQRYQAPGSAPRGPSMDGMDHRYMPQMTPRPPVNMPPPSTPQMHPMTPMTPASMGNQMPPPSVATSFASPQPYPQMNMHPPMHSMPPPPQMNQRPPMLPSQYQMQHQQPDNYGSQMQHQHYPHSTNNNYFPPQHHQPHYTESPYPYNQAPIYSPDPNQPGPSNPMYNGYMPRSHHEYNAYYGVYNNMHSFDLFDFNRAPPQRSKEPSTSNPGSRPASAPKLASTPKAAPNPGPAPTPGISSKTQITKPQIPPQDFTINLETFRKYCREMFNPPNKLIFGPESEDIVPKPSGRLLQVVDTDILGVKNIKQRVFKNQVLEEGDVPEGAPYEDVAGFVSTIAHGKLTTGGEEPETMEDINERYPQLNGVWGIITYYEYDLKLEEKKVTRGNFFIDGGYLASEHRFSLGLVDNPTRKPEAFKIRKSIIKGIRFSYKTDGSVWIQNNMPLPIFVTSGYLDEQSGGLNPNKVHKIYGTGRMKVFGDSVTRKVLRDKLFSSAFAKKYQAGIPTPMDEVYKHMDPARIDQEAKRTGDSLVKYCVVSVSFCKGFGDAYPERPEIKNCPVWIELKINHAFNYMDNVMVCLNSEFEALQT